MKLLFTFVGVALIFFGVVILRECKTNDKSKSEILRLSKEIDKNNKRIKRLTYGKNH